MLVNSSYGFENFIKLQKGTLNHTTLHSLNIRHSTNMLQNHKQDTISSPFNQLTYIPLNIEPTSDQAINVCINILKASSVIQEGFLTLNKYFLSNQLFSRHNLKDDTKSKKSFQT